MRPGDHLHLHLPDFDVGGTEQWALAMGAALSDLPCRRTVTAGVRLDAAAIAAFHGWRPIAIDDIPQQAFIVAPCDIERLVSRSRRVIAVAHGMNDYYKQLFFCGRLFQGRGRFADRQASLPYRRRGHGSPQRRRSGPSETSRDRAMKCGASLVLHRTPWSWVTSVAPPGESSPCWRQWPPEASPTAPPSM